MDQPQDPPFDVGTLMARVSHLIDIGRPEAARPLMSAIVGVVPPCSKVSLLSARLALSDGVTEDTWTDLNHAVAADPENPGLRKCRAELRRRADDLEGATRDAADAVIYDRSDPASKALLGVLLHELGRFTDAAACLREAVGGAPDDVSYREALSHSQTALGDLDGAMATLLEGIALTPHAIAMHNDAILLCLRRQDFRRAEELAEQGRTTGVADAVTFALKGHALSSLGRHVDAALSYEEALKLAPGDTYVRHLAVAARMAATAVGAPSDYILYLFNGYAERFDSHLISLGYRIPGLIRRQVIAFSRERAIGPVLDLGCGTGLASLALSDLDVGPFTGIDLSPRMLELARNKDLYSALYEAELPAALPHVGRSWNLIIAADLMCYFGAIDAMLDAVQARLTPGGRFIFSVEELLPAHDGTISDDRWALGRMGRYAHSASYVLNAAIESGLRCVNLEQETLRHEATAPVAGLLIVLERPGPHA